MYRPAGDSDSDSDDYGDFSTGYEKPIQRPLRIVKSAQQELDDLMYNAVVEGDLDKLKEALGKVPINLDDRVRDGYSLLMLACDEGHPHIVRYLIEKGATVNMEIDSYTPLMMACRSEKDSDKITEIVKDLLDNGAVVNQSNIYGDTPLIFASQNGHTEVVRLIVKDASLDACNNQYGNSAIFFAVEKNYKEIAQLLLENGASYNLTNHKGYLPKVIAEMHGFSDIVALFPVEEEEYRVPCNYISFEHYTDLVPNVLRKSTVPLYFYRVREILNGLQLESLLPAFAKSNTSLPHFLTMNEQKLQEAGIDLPIMQKKVMHGLLRFHAYKWSNQSILPLPKTGSHINTFQLYTMLAGHLQHLVVLRCSLVFLFQLIKDRNLPEVKKVKLMKIAKELDDYLHELDKMFCDLIKIRHDSPDNLPDEITPEMAEAKPKQNVFLKKIIKFSSIVGVVALVGIFLRFKLK